MGTAKLDPANPSYFPEEAFNKIDALSAEKIERNALDDPDNPPLTEAELEHIRLARSVRTTRLARGMTQSQFAKTYQIAVGRLRDWEQGRFQPDAMARAYLETIRYEPEAVARALRRQSKKAP